MTTIRAIAVVGDVAFVPLTQGKTAIIDAWDVPLVEGRNWCVATRRNRLWYAVSNAKGLGRTTVLMHRVILQPPEGMETDHVNHNGLDNRRCNLRSCTISQNQANRWHMRLSSSQFRGVSWDKARSRWQAQISKDNKKVPLGRFDNEVKAAEAYDDVVRKLHGDFASLNFPCSQERLEAKG